MTLDANELNLLRSAIGLAASARAAGDPPFGSLLADASGRVIAEERNTTLSDDDITAHPELKLARWAASNLRRRDASLVTMFTSCEPCGMCAGAISRSGIGRVVFALSGAQLAEVKPENAPSPLTPWTVDGPHLHPESTVPLIGYYSAAE
ncbi:nucleoside deaminase [Microbacterium sp. NPDC058345]|uniref:nucleoside deaminase n=1 Tax=Microbacterium sp. NPDC058345 TaxID=3346455 RepID=UPI00365D0631